jgi:hypothetical protein
VRKLVLALELMPLLNCIITPPVDLQSTYFPLLILSLPHRGHRKDVIRTKAFENYIQDNVVSWFTWGQKNKLGVDRMEDLILVTGCTLVSSWAAAAFVLYH